MTRHQIQEFTKISEKLRKLANELPPQQEKIGLACCTLVEFADKLNRRDK